MGSPMKNAEATPMASATVARSPRGIDNGPRKFTLRHGVEATYSGACSKSGRKPAGKTARMGREPTNNRTFDEFAADNPHCAELMLATARGLLDAGHRSYSAARVLQYVEIAAHLHRSEIVGEADGRQQISDQYAAGLAEWVGRQDARLVGFLAASSASKRRKRRQVLERVHADRQVEA